VGLDNNNPVAACDLQQTTTGDDQLDNGTGNSITIPQPTYDSFGGSPQTTEHQQIVGAGAAAAASPDADSSQDEYGGTPGDRPAEQRSKKPVGGGLGRRLLITARPPPTPRMDRGTQYTAAHQL